MAFGDITVLNEFTAEQAGQRVGWTSVTEASSQDGRPFVAVDVVVATIGDEGARLGYHESEEAGETERRFSSECAKGFLAVTGVGAIIPVEDEFQLTSNYFTYEAAGVNHHFESAYPLLFGVDQLISHTPTDDQKKWGQSPGEIITNLQEGLAEHDIQQHYPQLYYHLNMYLGHEEYRSRDAEGLPVAGLLLPDAQMNEETLGQMSKAFEVADQLAAVKAEDRSIKNRLVLSDISTGNLPDVFVDSRHKVTEIERWIGKATDELMVGTFVGLPIGFSPEGRTWPYMDPLAADDQPAFGPELQALSNGDIQCATYSLDDELRELEHRIRYAQLGTLALTRLAVAEQRLIESAT